MSAKRRREASDPAAWRRHGRALARVLESVENHKVDWRDSQHIRKALADVDSLCHPEVELYLGVEIVAGWLAHLIREFALDESATRHQMQFIIGAARAIIENGALALAAQKIVGSREIDGASQRFNDQLRARKESQKKQTENATMKRRRKKKFLDDLVPALAKEYRDKPGKSNSTPETVAGAIIDSVNSKLKEAGLAGKKDIGVDAIASRLRANPTNVRP